ncbi:Fatty acid amide hydrolase, partial [Globisporangium splendens]
MRIGLVLALVVALFSALLLLGEKEKLPSYEQLQLEYGRIAEGGYDLVNLASPRLFGKPLQLIHLPVIGRVITGTLAKDNKIIEVRKYVAIATIAIVSSLVASFVPDMPVFLPYIDPKTSVKKPAEQMSLEEFSAMGVTKKTSNFKHWSIADYTSRYASGELTPLQVARAVLAAVAENEKSEYPMHFFIEKYDDLILEQAKESSKRYAEGKPLGVLDGVPIAIKDETEIKGFRTTAGTSFLGIETGVATADSTVIARLRAAGAIILGKTNMHEVGAGVTGYNMHYGTVRNPHNPKHYTGGSSSGSAAIVASGIVPLALGVDGGGSIRIPAGLCGVVGIKPTFQRVPPLMPDCPSVCHIGPIAGSVRDAAIGYAVMSGADDAFPRSYTQPAVDLHSFEDTRSLKGVKIGYFSDYSNHSSPEVASAVNKAMQELKARGAELIETKLNYLTAIHTSHSVTISSEFAASFDKYYSRFSEMSPEVQLVITFGRSFSSLDFLAAQKVRAFALRQFEEQVFSKVDVFVTPTTGITAPEIPTDALDVGELNAGQLGDIFRFSVYGNFIGIPGIAVPIGYDKGGLPISLQFQANHWEEDIMLRLAHATERLYEAKQKKPEVYFSIIDDAVKFPRD